MKVFRIEEITLKPMIVLAHDMDDAVNIFAYELVMGLGHRPDADFSVVEWRPKPTGPANPSSNVTLTRTARPRSSARTRIVATASTSGSASSWSRSEGMGIPSPLSAISIR